MIIFFCLVGTSKQSDVVIHFFVGSVVIHFLIGSVVIHFQFVILPLAFSTIDFCYAVRNSV